jgi:hypothetical protein
MSSDNLPAAGQTRRGARFRFSFLALLVFVTLVCMLLAWAVQPKVYFAEALFQVNASPPKTLDDSNRSFNEREFDILRRTQLELIKSDFVLQAALRGPGVAILPQLRSQRDPAQWLHDHLEVEFPNGSEVLAIRLPCTEAAGADACKIVNGVANAYLNEVVFANDQEQLVTRDALAKSTAQLSNQLNERLQMLSGQMKDADKDSAKVKMQQLELDTLTETWRKARAALNEADFEAESPKRILEIQPAVMRSK